MAVNKRPSGKAPITGQDPNKVPPLPQVNHAVAARVDGGQDESAYIRLVGCSTYVTPKREAFKSKTPDGMKPLVYEVALKDLDRYLRYQNDYGEKFFKRVNPPGPGQAVVHAEDVNSATVEEPPKMREGFDDHSDDYVPPDQRVLSDDVHDNVDDDEIDTASRNARTRTRAPVDDGVTRLRDSAGKPSGGVEV